tara:strand:- start:65 stop:169 length:105 start_codon:yes stop_codon:yes gene_type:complete
MINILKKFMGKIYHKIDIFYSELELKFILEEENE